ncbi:MAG: hypothetical protein L3K04_06970, partial [Thermoplasmata archaeon]|nr:hypothetical protein [Thermoplasmata archaeon]
MEGTGNEPGAGGDRPASPWRRFGRRLRRLLTTTQLLVIGLLFLAGISGAILGTPSIVWQLLLFPAVAGGFDLLLSGLRYGQLRVPWSGIATGLFLALLLPPASDGLVGSGTNLLLAGAFGCLFGILGKHLIRVRGHPVFNPAASSLLLMAALWRITPAWWGAVSLPAVLAVGALIAIRSPRRSVIALSFFGAYAVIESLQRIQLQGVAGPGVLLLGVADPSILFFTLLLAVEPRSAPSGPRWYAAYGLAMGFLAGGVGILAGAGNALLASESLLVGLVLANLLALILRVSVAAPRSTPSASPGGGPLARAFQPRRGPAP